MNLRLDDLQLKNLYIYQDTDSFCFGVDAVLLSNFAAKYIRKKDSIIDLCSGNGIIPILLYGKKGNEHIDAVEINADMCEVFKKSLEYNKIDTINIINEDINNIDKTFFNSYDNLTVNPPYYKVESGESSPNDNKKIARHEILCNFDDIVRISAKLLKTKGKFFLIHRTPRLEEILLTLDKYNIKVKDILFIYPRDGKNSNLFILRGVKNGNSGINILPPLTMYKNEKEYTEEFLRYYYENN